MDDSYIVRHLIKWAELFYGKDKKCYAFKKKKYYYFGSKKFKIENKLSKQIVLYLVNNQLPKGMVKKERYQITYLNLETNRRNIYSNGAIFDLNEVKQEIKTLKKEQKDLSNLNQPRNKSDFKKKKIIIV